MTTNHAITIKIRKKCETNNSLLYFQAARYNINKSLF